MSAHPPNGTGTPQHADEVLAQLDPTRKASITEADGAPPPAPVQATVRRATFGGWPMALLRRLLDADVITQSAALAFYAALSIAPLILLLLWLTASSQVVQAAVIEQVGLLAGPETAGVAQAVVDNARSTPDTRSIAGWWSILLLLVGATAVFAQLQEALNRIFRTDATALTSLGDWLKKRLFSFGVLLALGFLLLVSMTVTTALDLLLRGFDALQPALATLASLFVYAIAFAFMYHFLPDRRVHWRIALAGGAFTAALFVLGRFGISWYLSNATTASAYGAMGALMLAMLWVYYASIILFVGAAITATIDERMGKRIEGTGHGTHS